MPHKARFCSLSEASRRSKDFGRCPVAWSKPASAWKMRSPAKFWEETGLRVEAEAMATVFERIMPDDAGRPEYHYVLVDFYCKVLGGDLRAGDDSRRAQWFSLSALNALPMTEGTREVIETCRSGRRTLSHITRP